MRYLDGKSALAADIYTTQLNVSSLTSCENALLKVSILFCSVSVISLVLSAGTCAERRICRQ